MPACDSIIFNLSHPYRRDQVIGGRVWLWPRGYVIQMTPQSYAAPFRYWGKHGLAVKKGPANVRVLVAARWRDRVSIRWGNAGGPEGASSFAFPSCHVLDALPPWSVYAGGFFARKRICAALVVVVGKRRTLVPVALGRRCPARKSQSHLVTIPISAQEADVVGSFDGLRASGFRVALTKSIGISDLHVPGTERLLPRAGTRLLAGSVVRVVPGFGPIGSPSVFKSNPHYRVPNFVGKRASTAIAWAKRKSMFWAIPHLPALESSSAPHLFDAYRVVAQQPRPGGTIRQGVSIRRSYHPTPLTLTVTPSASAAGEKSQQARLLGKLPLQAHPGSLIRVKWTVEDRSRRKGRSLRCEGDVCAPYRIAWSRHGVVCASSRSAVRRLGGCPPWRDQTDQARSSRVYAGPDRRVDSGACLLPDRQQPV